MGVIRNIALAILGLSFTVFIALFGRLPVFRKTPIGFCNRLICLYIPRGCLSVDIKLTGGRVFGCIRRTENYCMNEKHPFVLIFFLALQIGGQCMFIPAIWTQVSAIHHILIPIICCTTYYQLYLGYATQSTITHQNHHLANRHYPYDHVLYHPGVWCRTCQFPKPARSKHCSVCRVCVSKMDHHCAWLNNCVGRNNYIYFLSLLLSVSIMLLYATFLGYGVLSDWLQTHLPGPNGKPLPPAHHWTITTPPMTWSRYFTLLGIAIGDNVRMGTVTLLTFMSFPLSTGLLSYHIYLIWAGMTTNESSKWGDLRDDVNWGVVWKARRADLLHDYPLADPGIEPREADIDASWKGDKSGTRDPRKGEGVNNGSWVVRLRDRREIVRRWRVKVNPPAETTDAARTVPTNINSNSHGSGEGSSSSNGGRSSANTDADADAKEVAVASIKEAQGPPEMEPGDQDDRWERVESLQDIVNIYDLGFWENLKEALFNR